MIKCVKDVLQDDFWIMPSTPEFIKEGIPYITSKNIKKGKIDFDKVSYISQESFDKISKNRPILIGDILISMIGTLGETAEVTVDDGLFYGQNMFLVRLDETKVNKRYFLNYFKSDFVARALSGSQNQSTQRYLKANHIEDLQIPIPTLEQQEYIACILDKISELIIYRKQQLAKLDELVKARFIELFDGKYETKTLKSVCEELFAGGDVKKDKSSDCFSKEYPYPIYTNGEKNNGLYGYTSIARVKKEAVTISGRGTIGFTCLRKEPFYPAVRLIVAVPRQDLVSGCYLQHFIQSKNYGGQGASIPQLTVPMIKDELVPVPPFELQSKFAAFVEQIDKSKFAVQKALDEAQTLFDSLMQQYFG